jgi:cellulose synthase/poly-beta-1,6-N-acetylglucosamine synthase-like glycosyltransferase
LLNLIEDTMIVRKIHLNLVLIVAFVLTACASGAVPETVVDLVF